MEFVGPQGRLPEVHFSTLLWMIELGRSGETFLLWRSESWASRENEGRHRQRVRTTGRKTEVTYRAGATDLFSTSNPSRPFGFPPPLNTIPAFLLGLIKGDVGLLQQVFQVI
jgi:hypothetical protein